MTVVEQPTEAWPALPLEEWRETQATLHLWTQVVGKVKLALTPFLNEWWNVAFAVTPRGLTTGPIPAGDGAFAVDFDFVDHALFVRVSDGSSTVLALIPRSVADFYAEFRATLRALGIKVAINPLPVEVPDPIPFDVDREHASYDQEPVQRWWRMVIQTEQALQRFRSPFVGKSSPVHFFWGSFDLAVTRFSGRIAPPHPGGIPHLPDEVTREAYSHEVISAGFWAG
ncbi:MAG TPA: DUF5996 family protein, partial [Thermomicrobiales bacterium]|nr:DUF5996 family protein [Thermomicrobiales bacterium]